MAPIATTLVSFVFLGLFITSIKGSNHAKCDLANDLAVLLDSSASVKKEGFNLAKSFAKKLASRFSISPNKTRISVIAFSHYIVIPMKFRNLFSEEQVKEAVDRLKFEGSMSSTAKTLVTAQNEVFSEEAGARVKLPDVKMAAVFVTDGFSTGGIEGMKDKSDIMKLNGIEVFVVALGGETNVKEIRVMASEPKQRHVFQLKKHTNIDDLVNKVVREICKVKKMEKFFFERFKTFTDKGKYD